MSRHARSRRTNGVRYWILSHWPWRLWFRLPETQRDWWLAEYQRRHRR